MTTSKIPVAPKDIGKLSDVFVSALGAIVSPNESSLNRLSFPALKSAVVVLVDGLGQANLESRIGHAPNLGALVRRQPKSTVRCEFPSTTVVSLGGFSTGTRSAEHGLIGYNVRALEGDGLQNLLSGWGSRNTETAAEWKSVPTLTEIGYGTQVQFHTVSQSTYRDSGFTSLTMPSANFHGVDDLEDRVLKAEQLGQMPGNLVYLYVPELDQLGHMFGSESNVWSEALEQLDAALAPLLRSKKVPVIVTADHGMVDVAIENQIHLETLESLAGDDVLCGGDTRSSFVYCSRDIRASLERDLGSRAFVASWDELVEAGYVSRPQKWDRRFPDLVILARGATTLYDRRTCKPRSLKMLGHHGSISDAEVRVPLLRAGLLL